MLQGKKILKIIIIIFFSKKFQFRRDPHIAVGADGCVAAPLGLKCYKEKNKRK
jgi:hypothetical protein